MVPGKVDLLVSMMELTMGSMLDQATEAMMATASDYSRFGLEDSSSRRDSIRS
jgi:hypothetical protein